jgi:hypothetical protein
LFAKRPTKTPDFKWVWIASVITLAAGTSAIVFGVKGRRLAKTGAPGRRQATMGLVLGTALTVVSIYFALVLPLIGIEDCIANFC